ncbi:Sialic acid-binding Ig-like lectin 10 [Ophiophagus hannah]|uniref:Sialic acid-binding Ig-like lectin 10 n=1 Tax=Ophiophagus hannah TaxID=8665 RepID=V8NNF3_OPHHA|nr:Sialic acid-binding Ig-like lectin 10 [Ophiophagus hannah]
MTVLPSVSVLRGFTVYIPCQFTYNRGDLSRSGNLLAYWIKHQPQRYSCSPSLDETCLPVATNDQNQGVELSAKDRFYLLGDPEKGNCSLGIRDARIEDEGQYYLRIEQGRNLKYSFLHTLPYVYVIRCSKELAGDSELTAQEGDSLEVFCKADSNPPATTSWVKRDSPLQKPLDNQLRLTNLTVADEGVYVCKAINMLGDVQGTFQLSVTYAPKLSRSPQKNTNCSYHDNGFLCVCTLHAKPPPQIEWEVDGERITEERRRRGNLTVQKDESWFIVAGRSLFIAGICGIFLGAGILMLCLFLIRAFKQKKALLEASHVEGTPFGRELQEKPKNSSHIYGNVSPMGPRLSPVDKSKPAQERKPKVPQEFTAPAPRRSELPEVQYAAIDFKPKVKSLLLSERGNRFPLEVLFLHCSDNSTEETAGGEKVSKVLEKGHSPAPRGVIPEKEGEYYLEAPHHLLVEEGLCAMIPCNFTYNKKHASMDTKLHGFWKKGTGGNNEAKTVATSTQMLAENHFRLIGNLTARNCSLLILNAQESDEGNYFFRMVKYPKAKYSFFEFANPYLNVTRSLLNLAGQKSFRNISQVKVQKGDCIRLRCKVKGNPLPQVTWVNGTKVLKTKAQTLNVLVELPDLKPEDSGKYTCQAANELGSDEASLELSITDHATQEVNGVPSKPRSTHESVDGDPRDPEEIHYATLTFNTPNPKPDITAEETQTDYAEIRLCSSQGKEA